MSALRKLLPAAILLLVLGPFVMPAFAQAASSTSVVIPWGDWAAAALMTVSAVVLPVITWGLRLLPEQLQSLVRTAQVEQLLAKAVSYGINATAGAAQGRSLTVDIGSEVARHAVGYTIEQGPRWVEAWLGGQEGIRKRIIARLDVMPTAALQ